MLVIDAVDKRCRRRVDNVDPGAIDTHAYGEYPSGRGAEDGFPPGRPLGEAPQSSAAPFQTLAQREAGRESASSDPAGGAFPAG
jgi:hypothetical protein